MSKHIRGFGLAAASALALPFIRKDTDQQFAATRGRTVLDLARLHFTHRSGNRLIVMGTWLTLPGEVPEPCLVIARNDADPRKAKPFVVPLSSAWIWAPPPLGDATEAAASAQRACLRLRMDPRDLQDVMAIQTAVQDHLDHLIHGIPSMPKPERKVVAEITGRIGDLVIEREVRDV